MTREAFYFRVLNWAKALIQSEQTVLIGVNGPQGCGKTTLCEWIVQESPHHGFCAATLSIDDFYLTRQEQVALASRHPLNPYLQQRGYPGTHNVVLGEELLKDMKRLKKSGEVLCPRYDKSAHGGQGDRFPKNQWKRIRGPLDLILFEGWMLGFPTATQPGLNTDLRKVNDYLKDYLAWNRLLNGFLFLDPNEIHYVIHWRVEAEENRKAVGKPGMSKEEITAYVKKFLPAYEMYLPILRSEIPRMKNSLHLKLGDDRLPQ